MEINNQILYIDAGFGISGDMSVAALLDLGADREAVQRALAALPQEGFSVQISRVKKSGIDCCDFSVLLDAVHENHDHDMEYLYGKTAEHVHTHAHSHEEHIHEEHIHEEHIHEGQAHDHPAHTHRNLADIRQILAGCDMTDAARELANRIFDILAEAEAKAHGVPLSEVHFHEVGAIDSIVDIVAAAVCFDSLGIREVVVPRLGEGRGTVRTQHGVLPVPVPAVQNIAEMQGLDLEINDAKGEYVTPTGAAIAAALRTTNRLPKRFRIRKTGLGAGKRVQELPGILRMMLIEDTTGEAAEAMSRDMMEGPTGDRIGNTEGAAVDSGDCIWKLETNIDDCSGETLGYVLGLLMEAGARDVHYVPAYMKKNRPSWLLYVICTENMIRTMEGIIFRETTTIGIRRVRMERTVLPRRNETVETRFGEIAVKICRIGNDEKIYPEYSSVEAAARKNDVSFEEVYWEVRNYGKA